MSRQTKIDQFYKTLISKRGKDSQVGKSREIIARQIGDRRKRHTRQSSSSSVDDCTNSSDQRINVQKNPRNACKKAGGTKRKQTVQIKTDNSTSESIGNNVLETMMHAKDNTQKSLIKTVTNNIDWKLLIDAIEQLNLGASGAIPPNDFDLTKIYMNNIYQHQYNHTVGTTSLVTYKLEDVKIPKSDIYSRLLFTTIISVFSNPVNCGYFEKGELDFVFSILTLPEQALMLLVRMLKRQRIWFRKSNLNYPEIEIDLKNIFDTLVSHSICTFEIDCEQELTGFLELLQADEIRKLCRSLKLEWSGHKERNIERLKSFAKSKPLFSNDSSQICRLRSLVFNIIGYCVALTRRTRNIFDRIITLFIPGENLKASISDMFLLLSKIYEDKLTFPRSPIDQFPVFSTREQLIRYVEAKQAFMKVINCEEKKDWRGMQLLGRLARNHILHLLPYETERMENSTLPVHVKRYMPGYMWIKVLSKCVGAYKKFVEDKPEAVRMLQLLILQNCYMQNKKGKWYNELALIEMHDYKNLNSSANIILEAMNMNDISIVDRVDLLERAMKILKKKNGGIDLDTKRKITELLDSWNVKIPCLGQFSIVSVEIEAFSLPGNAGYKRMWCIDVGAEGKTYGSVETLAMYHYQAEGYPNGLHCEGSLPIVLFSILFWDELYTVSVPGAYLSAYQTAPQDLFTDEFYKNRKELIDMKLKRLSKLDIDTLSMMMQDIYNKSYHYESIIPSQLFMNESSQLKEIVHCLGVEGVLGICRQVLNSFKIWSAGFPDLIVWNSNSYKYKIVEVKGPMDTLSTKQRLWLDYLQKLGVIIEVCYVRSK